tara:strand:- start:3484 stop:5295 length:1812 start_codon:yes stop_codon:yes gene_type:complete
MYILGISAYYHDSAACIIKNGKIIAAAQEERFSRIKHDSSFPIKSINYCLKEAGVKSNDLSYISYYEKPILKFDRLLKTFLQTSPFSLRPFLRAMPSAIKEKIWVSEKIKNTLDYRGEIIFAQHHESHAASAFFPSPFMHSAILTMDAVGEWSTTSYGTGSNNKIALIKDIKFPHSIGLLYSAFTYYTGFRVNSGEYKLMGLAPYGRPVYKKIILDNLIDIKADGSFHLNMEYFGYLNTLKMTNSKFNRLFNGKPRKPETDVRQKDMDLAASIQEVTEDIILKLAKNIKEETKMKNLCLAGGVALNCVANGKLMRSGIFDKIWIQPAAGDAGNSLGTALLTWYQVLKNKRSLKSSGDSMKGSFLGPKYGNDDIIKFFKKNNISDFNYLEDNELAGEVAKKIEAQNVIGIFNGRMEFGPRALGSRSIIGDPRNPNMQKIMNLKIKNRESFRPFAPAILEDKIADYFKLENPSPYMLLVSNVKDSIKKDYEDIVKKKGLDKLSSKRSTIPAVTHVDFSARVQSVNKSTNPLFYDIISEFYKLTGCPIVINTSFNVRGEPIVRTPGNAFNCFMNTEMDYLLMGNYLLNKKKQSNIFSFNKQKFELD